MNNRSSKYLYCLVETSGNRQYSSPGVQVGGPVYTISHRDLAAVVSDITEEVIKVTAEECLRHEKLLEEVMLTNTLLPFEFGTVSPDGEAVIKMLKGNYLKVKRAIGSLRDKAETNVKAVWPNMNQVFKEIVSESRPIALYKKEIQKKSPGETYEDRIKIGHLVAEALYVKKEKEMYSIVTALKRKSIRYVPGKIVGDNMIFNGAFLVKRENLKGFESALYRLGDKLEGRVDFTYAGPLPPYNFTNLRLTIRH